MILGLSGKASSGKDSAADYLLEKHNWTRKTGFAINFKIACMEVFNLTEDQVFTQEGKSTEFTEPKIITPQVLHSLVEWMQKTHNFSVEDKDYSHILNKKLYAPRNLLQFVGTDIMRYYVPDYHMEVVFKNVQDTEKLIIADIRFPNEAQGVLDNNGILVRLTRPTELRQLHFTALDGWHTSETALDGWKDWSYSIPNDSTDLKILYKQIDTMLEDLKI